MRFHGGKEMADSHITKWALSAALKELMQDKPFEKISVADICQMCQMHRQSFYYHFKDKYDLVNWIFDNEFIAVARKSEFTDQWDFMHALCTYFFTNREFYRKVLTVKGQNSFTEHFREYLHPVLDRRIGELLGDQYVEEFHINFFADALICTIERWLSDKHSMQPQELIRLLQSLIHTRSVAVSQDNS